MEHIEVVALASDTSSGAVTATEPDLVDKHQPSDPEEPPDSEIYDRNIPDVQQTPVAPARPQLRLTNPDYPVRYIPIHVW